MFHLCKLRFWTRTDFRARHVWITSLQNIPFVRSVSDSLNVRVTPWVTVYCLVTFLKRPFRPMSRHDSIFPMSCHESYVPLSRLKSYLSMTLVTRHDSYFSIVISWIVQFSVSRHISTRTFQCHVMNGGFSVSNHKPYFSVSLHKLNFSFSVTLWITFVNCHVTNCFFPSHLTQGSDW